MTDPKPLSGLAALRAGILAGTLSPVELTAAALERASTSGARLRAFLVLDEEGALAAARAAQEGAREGSPPPGPLHGIPLSVKDLIETRGLPTSAGSRALGEGLPGRRDALLVRRLRRAGAVLIGKTHLNEFAYGIDGANAHFGQALNPWDEGRVPGGSSSGSAVAVASDMGAASVGTDTRGSIRIPAACCGVTGFKPTRGVVPTDGVFPLSDTLDHAGPLARSVADAALLAGVMAGRRSLRRFVGALDRPLEGLRLGLCPFFFQDVDPEVEGAVRAAVDALADAGMVIRELEIPELEGSLLASAVIAGSEALDVHDGRLRERRGDYGAAVRERLENGYRLTALDLARALAARRRLAAAYRRAFREVDCMAGPTLPGLPARIGSATMRVGGGREEPIVDASCRLVAPQNMTGAPALSVPCGVSTAGLPVGLQLWSAPGRDDVVLTVGAAYQGLDTVHLRRPPELRAGA